MKTENITNSYEIIKDISRGKHMTKQSYLETIEKLRLCEENKKKLLNLTPQTYFQEIYINDLKIYA